MLAAHCSAPLGKLGHHHLADAPSGQIVEGDSRGHDVGDGVDGAHLMEVHLVNGHPVSLSLRLGDELEYASGKRPRPLRQHRRLQNGVDLCHAAMLVAMPRAMGVPVEATLAVVVDAALAAVVGILPGAPVEVAAGGLVDVGAGGGLVGVGIGGGLVDAGIGGDGAGRVGAGVLAGRGGGTVEVGQVVVVVLMGGVEHHVEVAHVQT